MRNMNWTKIVSCLAVVAISTTLWADDPAQPDKEQTTWKAVKAGELTLQIPEGWKQQQPSNNLRLAQFAIPPQKPELEGAELVISGPFGGSAAANIQRWLGQFAPDGREVKMTQGTSEQGEYIVVDMKGTYQRSVGPPILRKTEAVENFRVLNIMLRVENERGGNYFLKLTGPQDTVAPLVDDLRRVIGADPKAEKDYEL